MRIDRVALRGFLSHADTDWRPVDRFVTIVGANGAGKSSMIDAIAFALYDDARARADRLVSTGATDMSVTVELVIGPSTIRVVRGRTTKGGGKPFLELHQAVDGGWMPLTMDTIRETEAKIAELVGLDAAAFRAAALLMQGSIDGFVRATPADRKRLLGTILGLDVYARAHELAKERRRELAAEYAVAHDRAFRLGMEAEHLDERRAVVAENAAFLAGARARVTDAAGALATAEGAVARVDAQTAGLPAAEDALRAAETAHATEVERDRARIQELAELRKQRSRAEVLADPEMAAGIRDEVAELPVLRAEEVAGQKAIDDRAAALRAVEADLGASIDAEIAFGRELAEWQSRRSVVDVLQRQFNALQPVVCPACESSFAADPGNITGAYLRAKEALEPEPVPPAAMTTDRDRAKADAARARELPADPAGLDVIRRRIRSAERAEALLPGVERAEADLATIRSSIERAEAELAAGQADRVATAAAGNEAMRAVGELRAIARSRPELVATVAGRRAKLDEARARVTTIERTIAVAEDAVRRTEATAVAAAAAEAEAETLDAERERYDVLAAAFGVAGIPARIIESVLPEIGANAAGVLGDLRPGMTVELSATRAKRDGSGIIEALDVIVGDERGERTIDLLSGGERASVSLAIAVALARLAARRAGTAIRTFVIDEPDGLDVDARRSFGLALRTLASSGDLERIVLISHHPDLADYGDATYLVTKDGLGSSVSRV